MKIAFASDDAGLELKNILIELVKSMGHEAVDFGLYEHEKTADYPDYGRPAAEAVSCGECSKGILVCGTGIGMSLTANKVKGIRCAVTVTEYMAQATREHNDSNMIALGARIIDEETAKKITEIFLSTPFSGAERHIRRLNKVQKVEDDYFK